MDLSMYGIWGYLIQLFDVIGLMSSDFLSYPVQNVSFFLLMFFYIMLSFVIILAVFRLIARIADIIFSSRWYR